MRFGDGRRQGERGSAHRREHRRSFGALAPASAVLALVTLVGCGHTKAALPPTTIATTTTSTTLAVVSKLTVVGVRPGVLQAPFYPQVTISQVSCGVAPKGGRFVRIDLPPGAGGTPAKSVLTVPTAVIVVPGAALLADPRYIGRVLYAENMKSITTSLQGALVLTLQNLQRTGSDGLSVMAGNVQVVGDYECPAVDVAFPGT